MDISVRSTDLFIIQTFQWINYTDSLPSSSSSLLLLLFYVQQHFYIYFFSSSSHRFPRFKSKKIPVSSCQLNELCFPFCFVSVVIYRMYILSCTITTHVNLNMQNNKTQQDKPENANKPYRTADTGKTRTPNKTTKHKANQRMRTNPTVQ